MQNPLFPKPVFLPKCGTQRFEIRGNIAIFRSCLNFIQK